jgi:hypothetical protein
MATLIYSMIMSLDGYTEDAQGNFGWGAPAGTGVHSYVDKLVAISRHLPLRPRLTIRFPLPLTRIRKPHGGSTTRCGVAVYCGVSPMPSWPDPPAPQQ